MYLPVLKQGIKEFRENFNARSNSADSVSVTSNKKAQAVPVLLYHSILQKSDGANVTIDNFFSQMKSLKEEGYSTISLWDFYEFTKGTKEIPEKSFLLTFDDGPKTSYYPVDPILRQFNFTAVSYIITHYSIGPGSRYYLSSNEIKKMIATGRWEIQYHSDIGHTLYKIDEKGNEGRFYPNKLWRDDFGRLETDEEYTKRVQYELTHGQELLQREFGIQNISFAFPFGDFAQNETNFPQAKNILHNVVGELFPVVFYQAYRGGGYTFNYPNESQFMKKRIIVDHNWNGNDLLKALRIGTPKALPYTDSFVTNSGWTNTWGKQTFDGGGMLLETDNTEGGSVFLDGTYNWKNYHTQVNAIWGSGNSFSILSRYKDNNTFISCTISNNYVTINESVDGKIQEIAKGNYGTSLSVGKPFFLAMNVDGEAVSCSEKETLLVKANLPKTQLVTGGIGFKNWGEKNGQSNIRILQLTVDAL